MFGKLSEVMVNASPTLITIGFIDLSTAFCRFVVFFKTLKMFLEESFIFDAHPNAKFMHIRHNPPIILDSNAIDVTGDKLRIQTNNIVRTSSSAATIYICSKN